VIRGCAVPGCRLLTRLLINISPLRISHYNTEKKYEKEQITGAGITASLTAIPDATRSGYNDFQD
jgi:hypothetical protein